MVNKIYESDWVKRARLRAKSSFLSSLNLEDGFDLKQDSYAIVSDELDFDVVVEGRGNAWDIEAEIGGPVLSNVTNRLDTVAIVTGTWVLGRLRWGHAVVGHIVGNGTHKEALEVDRGERSVRDVPDSANVENLS